MLTPELPDTPQPTPDTDDATPVNDDWTLITVGSDDAPVCVDGVCVQ